MNDRLKNLLKRIEDEKNESIFNICVNQIVKLYSLNPTFGGMIKAKIVQFMMSKQMFQRQLAAALFENLVEPVHEHVSQFLTDTAANEQMTSVFAVEPFAEILGEKTSDFDKIVETSMKDMDLDAMVLHIKNAQNYLYSRDEKYYNQSKKNKTNAIDETYVMGRIGGTETLDVRTLGESDNPEEYLLNCIEKSKNKKGFGKGKVTKKVSGLVEQDDDDEFKDEVTKKLKIQEDLDKEINEAAKVRISTILIHVLDVARILLFNHEWEIRHGASLIIRAASRKAGLFYYFTHQDTLLSFKNRLFAIPLKDQILKERESGIRNILEDTIIRSLLILALDRFSDFIGDQSNMIVRDISSQSIAESLNFIKSPTITGTMIKFFKELLVRDVKNGWEPKQGSIYLMDKLISKIPSLTAVFFKEFSDIIDSRIEEHEEILEISCGFFQRVLENDAGLYSSKAVVVLCKSYLEATQKLDDISFAVSPASRLIGDFFKTLVVRNGKEEFNSVQGIKTLMVKFFFHHMQKVRSDLFYLLSNWLIYQGKRIPHDGFKSIVLLLKMYLVGIYTESDAARRKEMISYFYVCADNFDDDGNIGVLGLISEFCVSYSIKVFLKIEEDKSMEDMVQNSKSWTETGEEIVDSIKLFSSLGEVAWRFFSKLKPAKRQEAIKILTAKPNSLTQIFLLSILFHQTQSEAKEQKLAGLPDCSKLLETALEDVHTPQTQFLMESFLSKLDAQVKDHLGQLTDPEIVGIVFKLLKVLALSKEAKWREILAQIEAVKEDVIEVKKQLHALAKSHKISSDIYKMQAETIDTKILKDVIDLISIVNKLLLFVKGLAASIITNRAEKAKEKPASLNQIIKPLLSLLKHEEIEENWAQIFAKGLFNICVCYEDESSHPNHKIVANFLSHCSEKGVKIFAQDKPEDLQPAKADGLAAEINSLHCLKYFEMIYCRYAEKSFEKYHNLKEIFNSPKLVRLFVPIFCKTCPGEVLNACITRLTDWAEIAGKNQDYYRDFKNCFVALFLDANLKAKTDPERRQILNQLLSYLHQEVSKNSIVALETLLQLLNDHDKVMLPYSKLYIKRALKLINADLDYDHKRLVYDLFTRILTLSYVQDSEVQPEVLSEELLGKWLRGNEFLLEFRSNKLYNVDIPDVKSVKLRPYQMEGIAWINFLFKYHLSGALCDDMGLGKTIQSLITVLIYALKEKGAKNLIVCPNSLTKHWEVEAKKHYQGYPMTVAVLDKNFTGNWKAYKDTNLFIISDSTLVKNVALFEKEAFLVGVLDEAHLIKNEKSKLSKHIKQLQIRHKLALTGTPIQNNLMELWSIFDFLMPNYLGTREEFKKSFTRLFHLNLINIDITKMDLNDEQTKDLKVLHQKVLPFIMRRLKNQVLKDLPEKIIQDYYCELTDVQKKVYRQFEESDFQSTPGALEAVDGVKDKEAGEQKKKSPLLQLLICMRKICNHPMLIGKNYFTTLTQEEQKDIKNFDHSGKLRGLRTLFEQLGFEPEEDNYDNPNKILIFTRFIDTIALLESFIRNTFPKMKHVKIDGQIDSTARYNIIDKFFNDYDIKVMLLTTKVGGLGLNLSCANIVVMFDHDFNPMNDLQAIERAHRLGQKKVVNVYRFIMKDTLEEKIMGIQKFKLSVANTVINMENSSISNIKDSKLVNLLDNLADEQTKKYEKEDEKKNPMKKEFSGAFAKIIENSDLKSIWEENEYDKEYR